MTFLYDTLTSPEAPTTCTNRTSIHLRRSIHPDPSLGPSERWRFWRFGVTFEETSDWLVYCYQVWYPLNDSREGRLG